MSPLAKQKLLKQLLSDEVYQDGPLKQTGKQNRLHVLIVFPSVLGEDKIQ